MNFKNYLENAGLDNAVKLNSWTFKLILRSIPATYYTIPLRYDFWYQTAPPRYLNFHLDPVFFQSFEFTNVPYELFGWDLVYYVEKVDRKVLKVTTANSWIMNNQPASHFVYYFKRE